MLIILLYFETKVIIKNYRNIFLCIIFILSIISLFAWPIYYYDLNWLSYSNDDMGNYSLAAQRLYEKGYYSPVDINSTLYGKSYSDIYWYFHVFTGVRPGSDLFLAIIWALTGINANLIFMPAVIALNLVLISAMSSLVLSSGGTKKAASIAILLLALSPLNTFAMLQQLIGQIGGLILMISSIFFLRNIDGKIEFILRNSLPIAICITALLIWYPELTPFLFLGFIIYIVGNYLSKKIIWIPYLKLIAVAVIFTLILTNTYFIDFLNFLLIQSKTGFTKDLSSSVSFPYFMLPSGIAAFWGFLSFSPNYFEPILSFTIFLGIFYTIYFLAFVIPTQIKKFNFLSCILITMAIMAILLFIEKRDFALFKVVMYMQPFFIGILAIHWGKKNCNKFISIPLLIILITGMFINQQHYIKKSVNDFGIGVPMGYLSNTRLGYYEILKQMSSAKEYILDTTNIVNAKYQALASKGISIYFSSRPMFFNISPSVDDIQQYDNEQIYKNKFKILKNKLISNKDLNYITFINPADPFNADKQKFPFKYEINSSEKNILSFIHSDLGNHYYLGDPRYIAYYPPEHDPMFIGKKFNALGRYILFEVKNKSEKPRIVFDITSTLNKQDKSSLPNPLVNESEVPIIGRGSARVSSDNFELKKIGDNYFLMVDMNREPKKFAINRSGLMNLYNKNISLDSRRITTFVRDISLITKMEYEKFKVREIRTFPKDLQNKYLEYSGIYEDGWISENSFFILAADNKSESLKLSGFIPLINDKKFNLNIDIIIDGKKIHSSILDIGEFDIRIPNISTGKKQKIVINFSSSQILPGLDGRIISAKIKHIGFNND